MQAREIVSGILLQRPRKEVDGTLEVTLEFCPQGLGTKTHWVVGIERLDRDQIFNGALEIVLPDASNRAVGKRPNVFRVELQRLGEVRDRLVVLAGVQEHQTSVDIF